MIYVMDHKTTGAFGLAKVAVDDEICSMMEEYFLHVRTKILLQNKVYESRFFLVMNLPRLLKGCKMQPSHLGCQFQR